MRFCATQQMQPFRLLFNTTIKVHLNIARKLFIAQCIPFPRQYHYSNSSDNAAAHVILTQRLALLVNFVFRILCSMFFRTTSEASISHYEFREHHWIYLFPFVSNTSTIPSEFYNYKHALQMWSYLVAQVPNCNSNVNKRKHRRYRTAWPSLSHTHTHRWQIQGACKFYSLW